MILRFLDLELVPARRELLRGGGAVEIQPLVDELLLYLIAHRDRVVPKDELLDSLWGDTAVTEASLARAVSLARRAIGDSDRKAPVIRNHPRIGYRFTAEVDVGADADPPPALAPPFSSTPRSGAPGRVGPARTGYADAGGTHIAYQVIGDGPVDLVIVHGWIL